MVKKQIGEFKDVHYNSPQPTSRRQYDRLAVRVLCSNVLRVSTHFRWKHGKVSPQLHLSSFLSITSTAQRFHHAVVAKRMACWHAAKYLGFIWQESTHSIDYWLNSVPVISRQDMFLCVWEQLFTELQDSTRQRSPHCAEIQSIQLTNR